MREALCCAVALLLFDRDLEAVADLFGELMLLPEAEVGDVRTRDELTAALATLADKVLVEAADGDAGALPRLDFNELITELA